MVGYPGQGQKWTDDRWTIALKAYVARGFSYSRTAAMINDEFGTSFSRNAAIGRGSRVGLRGTTNTLIKTPPRAYTRMPRQSPPKPPVLPVETIQMRCAEVIPHNVGLLDLASNGCRFPYGDGPFTFCNHTQFKDSYCEAHFQLCRGAGTSSERAATKVSHQMVST